MPAYWRLAAVAGFFWLREQSQANEARRKSHRSRKGRGRNQKRPPQPAFNVVLEGETRRPRADTGEPSPDADSVEARNFRTCRDRLTAAHRDPRTR